jgi:hypothetical protein
VIDGGGEKALVSRLPKWFSGLVLFEMEVLFGRWGRHGTSGDGGCVRVSESNAVKITVAVVLIRGF